MTLKKEPRRKKEENSDSSKVEDLTKVVRRNKVESQKEQVTKYPFTKPSEINRVKEAHGRDVGKGVARIDYDTMDLLGLSLGDIVEIKGKRVTAAKILSLYPSDEGKNMIRIDSILRNNAKVDLEKEVTLRKIKTDDAIAVFVENSVWIPPIDERYIADCLDTVPITKGDNIVIPYFGGRLTFKVTKIVADTEVAIVREKTVFHVKENRASVTRELFAEVDKKVEQIDGALSELKSTLEQLKERNKKFGS
ncbi:MAG: hypothetical protein KGH65_01485 [Candidatus Micrarchaeota archaeon]|nr:hypothetical protein [Candidatus Micrarchaeota archaeon]